MSNRALSSVAVWLFSLIGIAAIAQSHPSMPDQEPTVISGKDIGFRVERYDGRRPVGVLVIRVDGQWVEPKSVPKPTPIGSR